MSRDDQWRYFAQSFDGEGEPVATASDLPLANVSITDVLSGANELTGTVEVEQNGLLATDGSPLLKDWATLVWAEASGQIRGGGIVTRSRFQNQKWDIECMGFAGYPNDQPYTKSIYWVQKDPLDIVRHIWNHLQSQPGGNLGMIVDDTTSPVRIGTEVPGEGYDQPGSPTFEDGPYRLSWYETPDLGQAINDLAAETPFEYWGFDKWNSDRTAIEHHLKLGYPKLGKRRHDIGFVVGENASQVPGVTFDGDDWASEVLFLGAGEGRDMIRSQTGRPREGRLRRVAVVSDREIRRKKLARRRSWQELAARSGKGVIDQIVVMDHPNAKLGSWELGDEVRIESREGWVKVSGWYRIMESKLSPQSGEVATLTVERSDRRLIT